jgi:hypothetical protein
VNDAPARENRRHRHRDGAVRHDVGRDAADIVLLDDHSQPSSMRSRRAGGVHNIRKF